MAIKKVAVPSIGTIHLQKRRGTKNLRLSISHSGTVRVSMPPWVPYRLGIEFALKKRSWLIDKQKAPLILSHGQSIGKEHKLLFIQNYKVSTVRTRVSPGGEIRVTLPISSLETDQKVQAHAERACIRALRLEAETQLPKRLRVLATNHKFSYNSVSIKRLTSRWGSCSERNDIVLNCYLMQLPWELIDYVLLHELLHTQVMAHGPRFWTELSNYVPDLTKIRKEIRQYKPILVPRQV